MLTGIKIRFLVLHWVSKHPVQHKKPYFNAGQHYWQPMQRTYLYTNWSNTGSTWKREGFTETGKEKHEQLITDNIATINRIISNHWKAETKESQRAWNENKIGTYQQAIPSKMWSATATSITTYCTVHAHRCRYTSRTTNDVPSIYLERDL